MGTETRVGIVAGLLIVVVASVYFFYGSRQEEDELLLTASGKPAPAVKIPPSQDAEPPSVRAPQKSVALTDARRQVLRPPVQQPVFRPGPPIANATSQPALALNRPGPAGAVAVPGTARIGNLGASPTTPLRSGPSPTLVDATKNNLSRSTSEAPLGVKQPAESTSPPRVTTPSVSPPMTLKPSEPEWPKRHKVAPGDTLEGLAEEYYGNPRKVPTLLAANSHLKPRNMRIGEIVIIPDPAVADRAAAEKSSVPPKHAESKPVEQPAAGQGTDRYRVESGDTFYSIATKVYGNRARWSDIMKLNRDLVKNDPKRLRPGMVLKLPPK